MKTQTRHDVLYSLCPLLLPSELIIDDVSDVKILFVIRQSGNLFADKMVIMVIDILYLNMN